MSNEAPTRHGSGRASEVLGRPPRRVSLRRGRPRRSADRARGDEFALAAIRRLGSVAQLSLEEFRLFAADGLATGDEPRDIREGDLLEQQSEDEREADERQQVCNFALTVLKRSPSGLLVHDASRPRV